MKTVDLDLRYRLGKFRLKLIMWLVWKLPRRLIYWCVIRAGAHATTGEYGHLSPTDATLFDILDRWENNERARQNSGQFLRT